jgi:hypothetical protein
MEKFQCPKCHVLSDVEVVPNQALIDKQNKLKECGSVFPFVDAEWYRKVILKDDRLRCIICPVCGDVTSFK